MLLMLRPLRDHPCAPSAAYQVVQLEPLAASPSALSVSQVFFSFPSFHDADTSSPPPPPPEQPELAITFIRSQESLLSRYV